MENERPTIEFQLPDSLAKVTMFSFIRGGDYRELQKELLKAIQIDVNVARETKKMEDVRMDKVSGDVTLVQEELALKYLIKEITTEGGEKIVDLTKFVYNCSIEDNEFIYDKADEITRKSRLSAESKKKLQKQPLNS